MALPFENNTGRVIGRLTRRSIRSAKMKTIFALVAIVLSVGLLSGMVLAELGIRTADKRSFATMQHVLYEQITEAQAQAIALDGRVSDSLCYKQGKYTLEVDDYLLALNYYALDNKEIETPKIVEGTYPEGLYEAAVDRAYLKRLGLPVELGQQITVDWLDGTRETFTVTGLTDDANTAASGVYPLYVSKTYAQTGSQLSQQCWNLAVRIQGADDMNAESFRNAIYTLGADYGLERRQCNELNSYVSSKTLSREEMLLFVVLGAGILFVSVLVIYNVFYISVVGRIRQFGQMRTLGATVKQIRRMVRREGKILCCIGAPVGLAIGGLVAYFICPKGWSWTNAGIVAAAVWIADYFTVLLSIRTPAKLASSVSPMEAFRASVGTVVGKQKETQRLHRCLTPMRLAQMGFSRNKKAAVITILSLGISGILFMVGFTVLNSVSIEGYSRQGAMKFGEVVVYLSSNAAEQNPGGYTGLQMDNPLDQELEQRLMAIDGVQSFWGVESLSMQFTYRDISSTEGVRLLDREQWDRIMQYVQGTAVSYDDAVARNMVITVDDGVAEEVYGLPFVAGDAIEMTWYSGSGEETNTETFTIGPLISKKLYRYEKDYDLAAEMNFFAMPADLARSLMPADFNFRDTLAVKTDYEHLGNEPARQVAAVLEEYPTLRYDTLESNMLRDQTTYDVLFMMIMGMCLFVIGFSMMNMVNTLVTSVITRKQEFTMLRSVGMSRKQLSASIRDEGLIYSFFNVVIAAAVGTPLGYLVVFLLKQTGAHYCHWAFPGWYLLGYGLLTALLPLIIAQFASRSIQSATLAEQLRTAES